MAATIGQAAYEAWQDALRVTDAELPLWWDVSFPERQAWEAAGRAARMHAGVPSETAGVPHGRLLEGV